jgi:hypothetical protein
MLEPSASMNAQLSGGWLDRFYCEQGVTLDEATVVAADLAEFIAHNPYDRLVALNRRGRRGEHRCGTVTVI